jgi:hypothetical protein
MLAGYLNNKGNPVPHAVHFDCHGGFGRKCFTCGKLNLAGTDECRFCHGSDLGNRDEGYLGFESADKRPHWVSAQELYSLLQGCGIRLCVLSACHSARVGGESVFGGVGPSLIRAGIPAIVAMQFGVTVEMARVFTREFYRSIMQGATMVSAVATVRAAMADDRTAWYRPVLYLRPDESNPEGSLIAGPFPSSPGDRQVQKPYFAQGLETVPALMDPDIHKFRELHWDRETIITPFVRKIKNREDPLRIIGVHGPNEAGFASLHERLAEICNELAPRCPLIHARVDLQPEDVPRVVTRRLVNRLVESGILIPQAQNILDDVQESMTNLLEGQTQPTTIQIAKKFMEQLSLIDHHFGVVLLLRAFQKIEKDTVALLETMIGRSPSVKGLLILLTSEGEANASDFLRRDPEPPYILYHPNLPTTKDEEFRAWARAVGVELTIERASQLNKTLHQNPDEIRNFFRIRERFPELFV